MKRWLLYILLTIQIIGLAGLYIANSHALLAPTYMLKVRPVDPRDLLRGDYMIIRYDISELPATVEKEAELPDIVYVILEEKDGFMQIREILPYRPYGDEVYLEARRRGRQLEYDMEKYFVPEGKGNPQGEFTVEAAIQGGQGRIKHFYVDGVKWP